MSFTIAKNLAPEISFTNVASSVADIKKFSNFSDLFGGINVDNEMGASTKYWNALTTNDPISELAKFYKNLDHNEFNKMDNQFVEFWLKRFNSSVDDIKDQVHTQDNNSFYGSFSDSIGLQANSQQKLVDSVIPISDTQLKFGPPRALPVSLNNKVSQNTRDILHAANTSTTTIYRTNIQQIQRPTAHYNSVPNSKDAHAQNLVTDLNHYTATQQALPQFTKTIYSTFTRLSGYVSFLSNIGDLMAYNPRDTLNSQNPASNNNQHQNQQVMSNVTFNLDVEGTPVPVGLTLQPTQPSITDNTPALHTLPPNTLPINITTEYIDSTFASSDASYLCGKTSTLPVAIVNSVEHLIIQQNNLADLQQSFTNLISITAQSVTSPDSIQIVKNIQLDNPTTNNSSCNGFKLPSFPLPDLSFLTRLIIPNLSFKILNLIPKFPRIDIIKLLKGKAFGLLQQLIGYVRQLLQCFNIFD